MEIFGFTFGRTKNVEATYRARFAQEFDERLSSTLDQLVHNQMAELKTKLSEREGQVKKLETDLSMERELIDVTRQKYESLKLSLQDMNAELEREREVVSRALIDIVAPFISKQYDLIIQVLNRLAGEYNVPYTKAFFKTLSDIDECMGGSHAYGLELISPIVQSNVGSVEDIRAVAVHAGYLLKRVNEKARGAVYDNLVEVASRGDFNEAQRHYRAERVHKDFVLNLSKTERELIRMKCKLYNNSWESMLKTAEGSRGDTRTISTNSDPTFTAKYIKKLMSYESKFNVSLECDEKDF